jgi:hypothetical protein
MMFVRRFRLLLVMFTAIGCTAPPTPTDTPRSPTPAPLGTGMISVGPLAAPGNRCSENATRQLARNEVNATGLLVPGDPISVVACLGGGNRILVTDNVGTIADAFNSVPLAPPGQVQASTCPLLRQGHHGADVFFFGYRQREAVVVKVEVGCGFVSNGRRSGRIDDEMLLSLRRLLDPLMQG